MKIRSKSLTKITLVLFLWIACIYKLYIDYDHKYLMDSLIHNFLIVIASLTSAFVINSDYYRYKQYKKLDSFISAATTLFCIAALLLTSYLLKRRDDTPSTLYATRNSAGLSSTTIDFRENNTYKLGRHHFMSTHYTRGHYTKKDSIIYLDKPDASEELTSDKFVLRTIPTTDSIKKKKQNGLLTLLLGKSPVETKPQTFLFQITNKGEIIESAITFRVTQKPFD